MENDNNKNASLRAWIFAILGVVLLALSVWVIWDDEFGLRPWKNYQEDYKALKREQLEKDYQQALRDFQTSGDAKKLADLQQKLKQAQENFKKKELHDRYLQVSAKLDDLKAKIAANQKNLQNVRGQFLEVDYYFTKNQKPADKAKRDDLQKQIDSIEAQAKVLQAQLSPLQDEQLKLMGDIPAIEAEIEALQKPLADKKERISNNETAPVEIKQAMINDADKADRCESCHAGIEDMKQVSSKQPYSKHPLSFVYLGNHDPAKFGCTFCHRGQGRATTTIAKAHGNVEYWDEPLLKGGMTQTSCLNCHGDIKDLRGAEHINQSTELIRKYGCYSCHKIPGYETIGDVGPELTKVGTKVNYSWAVNWLLDPKKYSSMARMPKFFFTQDQAEAVADYLFSMSGTTRHDVDYAAGTPDQKLVDQGKILWSQARCNLCHVTGGRGGNHIKMYAPELSKVGSKVNKTWLFNWIKNPNQYYAGARMPQFTFSDQEINALVEYIISTYTDDEAEMNYTTPKTISAASIKKGKDLIQQYGCYGCHKIEGMEQVQVAPSLRAQGVTFLKSDEMKEKIGTELTSIGSKPVELLDFGKMKKSMPNDRLSYIKQKLRDPRGYRLGLRMPNFRLSEKEIDELASVLYGFTDNSIPTRFLVPSKSEIDKMAGVQPYQFTGDFAKVIGTVKCINCHTIKGIGQDYAPNLTYAGSKLQEKWIRGFLANPDVIRPLLQQMPNLGLQLATVKSKITMPKFNLNKQTVQDTDKSDVDVVVNYFQQELLSPDVPKNIPTISDMSMEQQIAAGKALYDQKGCMVCHQIGASGGAVGPNLSNVGNRLNPGYIFVDLENPRKFKPDIVEPTYGFTERERILLTNYLMTLKLNNSDASKK
jgi:mono/diheme cytochrome c family protein/predicted  nucleic acid-binding Zn-ribbon protein